MGLLDLRQDWAVVVGINNYANFPKLKFAVNDAEAVYRYLKENNRVPPENIFLLIDKQASIQNLRNILGTRLKASAGVKDMVIIYFAGHGSTERDALSSDGDGLEKYLLAADSDPTDIYSTALPMREMGYLFSRIRSERLVFLVDSCYSGASGGRTVENFGFRANISDKFLERISTGRGKTIITASAANEVSAEKDELQHVVFTYYLLEGLKGKADTYFDKIITADEIYRYVLLRHPRVREAAVVGVADADWGEVAVAVVSAKAGERPGAEGLDALCLQHIARFKRPKRYVFVDERPKNATGKVLKRELRERLAVSPPR